MYGRRFRGCLRCGCELEGGTGSCLMCGQPLSHRRSWLRVLAESLEAQIDGSGGAAVPQDRQVVTEPHAPAQP